MKTVVLMIPVLVACLMLSGCGYRVMTQNHPDIFAMGQEVADDDLRQRVDGDQLIRKYGAPPIKDARNKAMIWFSRAEKHAPGLVELLTWDFEADAEVWYFVVRVAKKGYTDKDIEVFETFCHKLPKDLQSARPGESNGMGSAVFSDYRDIARFSHLMTPAGLEQARSAVAPDR